MEEKKEVKTRRVRRIGEAPDVPERKPRDKRAESAKKEQSWSDIISESTQGLERTPVERKPREKKKAKAGKSAAKGTGARETAKKNKTDAAQKPKEQPKKAGKSKQTPPEPKKEAPARQKPERKKSAISPKAKRVLRYGALSILFLGGMLAAIVFVFFKISAVEVISDANMKYRDVDVQMMCGFSEGQNMFAVSYDEAEEKIEQALPYIEKCTIKKRIPSTVLICVESAEPIGTVALRDGQRAIISHTGKVLELLIPEDFDNLREEAVTASDLSGSDISQSDIESVDIEENSVGASTYSQYVSDSDLAVIQGVAVERAIVGRPIESSDGTAIETVCEIMRLLDKYELTATAVDVTPGSITVNYQNRLELKFGTTIDLEKKMEAASIIILQEKVSVHENGRLDLTNPNKVVFTPEYLIRR